MKLLKTLITESAEILQNAGIRDPRRESYSLMAYAIGRDQSFLRAHPEYRVKNPELKRFIECVNRRAAREPFQHITGVQEFYGFEFRVTSDVLVPRPETELIVENALDIASGIPDPFFCDIGTGSGCIAISILKKLPSARAIASDISWPAVRIARHNAERLRVIERLSFLVSDVFEGLDATRKFDFIVVNPPYVPAVELAGLQREVRRFDPVVALTDGADGLSIVRTVAEESSKYLKSRGRLLMEIGFNQSESALKFFSSESWTSVETRSDLQSFPRIIVALRA